MIALLTCLLNGNDHIVEQMQAAKSFWHDYLTGKEHWSEEEWLRELNGLQGFLMQYHYEALFDGDRYIAKATLPYTLLASLYDQTNGFDDNSRRAVTIAKALIKNKSLSPEVKAEAEGAARLFHLDCIFRGKSAGDSGMKSATDFDLISAIPI